MLANRFLLWLPRRQEGIMDCRKRGHGSTVTGTPASPLRVPWMEIMDDSLESFRKEHMRVPQKLRQMA
ncbi:hypothetical protein [Dokdonella sp.]|uniref:hypothetical protein n=1 Tax=Dokdonella sp. TaxID=2291710 RepID=UPI0031C9A6CE|nr:hypothetical protein [Dokdonella sp.]